MNNLSNKVVDHLRQVVEEPDLAGSRHGIIRKIASGGMGTVYLVSDAELHRNVAMKALHTALAWPEMVQRTLQEARVIAGLEHPGIVPIHDVGTLPDGRVFYVMKYVEGRRLDDIVK